MLSLSGPVSRAGSARGNAHTTKYPAYSFVFLLLLFGSVEPLEDGLLDDSLPLLSPVDFLSPPDLPASLAESAFAPFLYESLR